MKLHIRPAVLLLIAAALLLAGCAAAEVPVSTETAPLPVVADPGDYDVKIYTIDPNAAVVIPDESVPLASSAIAVDGAEGAFTKRQAEAMAIQLAGLTHDDVSFLFAKEDLEDGVAVFEVSFRSADYEYEAEFLAATGEVLSFDKESIWD